MMLNDVGEIADVLAVDRHENRVIVLIPRWPRLEVAAIQYALFPR